MCQWPHYDSQTKKNFPLPILCRDLSLGWSWETYLGSLFFFENATTPPANDSINDINGCQSHFCCHGVQNIFITELFDVSPKLSITPSCILHGVSERWKKSVAFFQFFYFLSMLTLIIRPEHICSQLFHMRSLTVSGAITLHLSLSYWLEYFSFVLQPYHIWLCTVNHLLQQIIELFELLLWHYWFIIFSWNSLALLNNSATAVLGSDPFLDK